MLLRSILPFKTFDSFARSLKSNGVPVISSPDANSPQTFRCLPARLYTSVMSMQRRSGILHDPESYGTNETEGNRAKSRPLVETSTYPSSHQLKPPHKGPIPFSKTAKSYPFPFKIGPSKDNVIWPGGTPASISS